MLFAEKDTPGTMSARFGALPHHVVVWLSHGLRKDADQHPRYFQALRAPLALSQHS